MLKDTMLSVFEISANSGNLLFLNTKKSTNSIVPIENVNKLAFE